MRKAAEQGDCRAMRNLATSYRFSIGVEPDHAEADRDGRAVAAEAE